MMARTNINAKSILLFVLIVMLGACAPTPAAQPTRTPSPVVMQATPTDALHEVAHAQNIILLIGDGMGEAQRRIGRWAAHGQDGSLAMDSLYYHGWARTASADNDITDSPASATAMSTGTKTFNGRVAVDPQGNPLTTILEIAQSQGKSVGLITTVHISDATPAAFAAHVPDRQTMRHEIASQLLAAEVDVLLGGGEVDFLPSTATGCYPEPGTRDDGRNLIEEAKANGYTYVCDLAGFRGIDPQATPRLLGLFGDTEMLEPYTPSLLDMTRTGIEILSENPHGFFLMVEGAQIDWAGHANNAQRTIDNVLGFDEAVALALEFAASVENTLVIVAADHETGGLSLSMEPTGHPDEQGPFSMPDGTEFYVNWATDYHTAANIPVSAQGPMADSLVGTYENTHIFDIMHAAMTAEQAESEPEEDMTWDVIFRDDFDGSLQAGWTWQDEDPSRWSITGEGWLQIIGGDSSLVVNGEQENLLVYDLPDRDIALITHLSLLPGENYQYAGLHLMDGAGNLVAIARGYCGTCPAGGGTLTLYFRQDGEWGTHVTIPMEATDLYLLLMVDNGFVSAKYVVSEDPSVVYGSTQLSSLWVPLGSTALSNTFTQAGIGATNSILGGVQNDIVAWFDYVEILAE